MRGEVPEEESVRVEGYFNPVEDYWIYWGWVQIMLGEGWLFERVVSLEMLTYANISGKKKSTELRSTFYVSIHFEH